MTAAVWGMHLYPLQGPSQEGRVEGAVGSVGLLWALEPLEGQERSHLALQWLVWSFPFTGHSRV